MRERSRAGYEFSNEIKHLARRRARGMCQDPKGCDQPNNGRVDHLTSIKIAKLIGMDRHTVKSLANAQMLCDTCDQLKQIQERQIWQQLELGGGLENKKSLFVDTLFATL